MLCFFTNYIPSSTSQSNFFEFGTISILSFGPLIQLVAFINIIGSDGTGKPDSAVAEKFKPIATNLPGFVIQEPTSHLKIALEEKINQYFVI